MKALCFSSLLFLVRTAWAAPTYRIEQYTLELNQAQEIVYVHYTVSASENGNVCHANGNINLLENPVATMPTANQLRNRIRNDAVENGLGFILRSCLSEKASPGKQLKNGGPSGVQGSTITEP